MEHPARKENIVDLFFISNPNLVNQVVAVPPLSGEADHDIGETDHDIGEADHDIGEADHDIGEADHDIVCIDLNTCALVPKRAPLSHFMYSKADWDAMKSKLKDYTCDDSLDKTSSC